MKFSQSDWRLININSVAVLVLAFSGWTFGQSPYVKGIAPPTYASPNAAALGKFGDIPITYHTGTPEISIPIYTVTQGSLSLPISLSYHSSGVRVAELSSWVGLGWSLNAGGMITRTVHGGPDDLHNWQQGPQGYSDLHWGWYTNGAFPYAITGCENQSGMTIQQSLLTAPGGASVPLGTPGNCFYYFSDAALGYIDLEPDLYTFNVNGHSGKFFFDANKNVHMIPDDDFAIQPVINASTGAFDSWIIIGSDGNKYYFGTTAATEVTGNDPTGVGASFYDNLNTNTWYLYKIVSPNGEDEIDFSYTSETYTYGNRGGQSVIINQSGGYSGDVSTASTVPSISRVLGKRLSQITTSSGNVTVTFTGRNRQDVDPIFQSPMAQSLDNIQIVTPVGCKNFSLSNYYPAAQGTSGGTCCSGQTTSHNTRLILNSVQESDCNGNVLPAYTFTYNLTNLPSRYSLGRDKWDYYNGVDTNLSLFPNDLANPYTGIIFGTANRAVNSTYMQAGMLTKITYPTGGSTTFTYEPHVESLTSQQIGGLRVSQIVNDNGKGSTITKTIQYSGGFLYNGMPVYFQNPMNNLQKDGAAYFGTIVSASPNSAMWSTQGYHIGYSDVTEIESGNGKTIYHYFNTALFGHPDNQSYPMGESVAGFGTSDLSGKDVYREGESTSFVHESNYKTTGNNPYSIKARKVSSVGCLGGCNSYNTQNLYTDYYINTNRYHLYSTDVTKDGLTTHTDYEYGLALNSPTAVVLTDSNGTVNRTEWNYAITPGSGAPAEMYVATNPNFKNMIGIPLEQREYRNGVLVSKVQNNFTAANGNVLLTQTKQYPTGGTDFQESDNTYNASLRLSQITKSDGTRTSYVWGYGNSLPVAEAINADPNQIFYTSFEDQVVNSSSDARTGRKSYNASYTITLPTAGTYILSYWIKQSGGGTWQNMQTTISTNTTIGGNGALIDEIRLFPKGAQMTTYTHDPGIGITSKTDVNARSNFFQFDTFGRLNLVKDNDGNVTKRYSYNYKK